MPHAASLRFIKYFPHFFFILKCVYWSDHISFWISGFILFEPKHNITILVSFSIYHKAWNSPSDWLQRNHFLNYPRHFNIFQSNGEYCWSNTEKKLIWTRSQRLNSEPVMLIRSQKHYRFLLFTNLFGINYKWERSKRVQMRLKHIITLNSLELHEHWEAQKLCLFVFYNKSTFLICFVCIQYIKLPPTPPQTNYLMLRFCHSLQHSYLRLRSSSCIILCPFSVPAHWNTEL